MTPHRRIVESLTLSGWQKTGMRVGFLTVAKRFLEKHAPDFIGELEETDGSLRRLGVVPDAWRAVMETEAWGHPVLVLELAEADVTNSISGAKRKAYNDLWWEIDATENFHVRVLVFSEAETPRKLILPSDGTSDEVLEILGAVPEGR